ncbi:putative monocarboxylic acid transporter [Meredithblackwellia eburnea MCA 4105]
MAENELEVVYPPPQSIIAPSEAPQEASSWPWVTEALPPVDGGRDAWTFLIGATVIETLVWGWPFSIGTTFAYWDTVLFPEGTPGRDLLSLAATLQTGLMYCSAIVFGPLLARYPHQRLNLQRAGLLISIAGIIGSAFATKPWHLVLTLGTMYPFSGLLYLPAATLLFEWFAAKRGLASGIMYAGTGLGGTVFPYCVNYLTKKFGYKAATVALGIGFGILAALALLPIKPRIPLPKKGSQDAKQSRRLDYSFLKQSPFFAFSGAILLSSLGNFVPSVWVPSFALDLNLTQTDGTVLVSVMNAASVPGLLLMGYLSDIWPLRTVITLSCMGSALSCLLMWGFATNVQVLGVFVVLFGALGLSFSALWAKLIAIIARDDPNLPGFIFSLFAFFRGIGNISSGPVSNKLLSSNIMLGAAGGYGVRNYGSLILYSGLTMAAGSIVGVLYRDKRSTVRRV